MEEAQKLNGESKIPPAQPDKKRQYTLDFKKSVQARVKAGESVSAVAKDLNIGTTQVSTWAKGKQMGSYGGKQPKPRPFGAAKRLREIERASKRAKKLKQKPKAGRKPRQWRGIEQERVELNRALGFDDKTIQRRIKDAVDYLTLAEKWMYAALRSGELTVFDPSHDYMRQALRELQKLKDL
jgi:transposase-like protein